MGTMKTLDKLDIILNGVACILGFYTIIYATIVGDIYQTATILLLVTIAWNTSYRIAA
jgi:hypothetical protein